MCPSCLSPWGLPQSTGRGCWSESEGHLPPPPPPMQGAGASLGGPRGLCWGGTGNRAKWEGLWGNSLSPSLLALPKRERGVLWRGAGSCRALGKVEGDGECPRGPGFQILPEHQSQGFAGRSQAQRGASTEAPRRAGTVQKRHFLWLPDRVIPGSRRGCGWPLSWLVTVGSGRSTVQVRGTPPKPQLGGDLSMHPIAQESSYFYSNGFHGNRKVTSGVAGNLHSCGSLSTPDTTR